MDIQQLVPVDYSNQRVLLTAQVAQGLACSVDQIKWIYSRHKAQFEEGVHFFYAKGDALRELKKKVANFCLDSAPFKKGSEKISSDATHFALSFGKGAKCLKLWTEQGVARLSKLIDTPQAWAMMDKLKIEYFAVEGETKPAMTPQVFNHPQFGNLRSVLIDGEPFFIGKDVATALGYKDTDQALRQHVPDKFKRVITAQQMASNQEPVKSTGILSQEMMGGVQRLVVISEAGLYKLIMRSKLPDAEKFSDWVCGEVLPSINKHGFYSVNEPVETSLFPDEPVTAKKKRRPLPEYAVVYSALLDNALVKIGLTCDFNRRIKEVRKETGLDVEDVFTTGNLPLDDARKLESTVKAKFHDKNKGGELYDAPFEQVKTAIRDAPNDAFDKLLALAEKVNSPDEKDKLLIRAANLI